MRAISETTLLAARVAAFPLVEVQQSLPVEMVLSNQPTHTTEPPPAVSLEPPVSLPSETAPISEQPSGMQAMMQDQRLFLQLNELVSRVPSGALATWLSKNLDPLLLGDLLDAFPQFKAK